MKAEDFRLGADVHAKDGQHVGALRSTLVDEGSLELKAIVVEESRAFSGQLLAPGAALITPNVLVPIEAVADAKEERVDLTLGPTEIRRLPPYLTYRRLPPTLADALTLLGSLGGGNPPISRLEVTAARPPGEIEIDQGKKVVLSDTGKRLGHVMDVLFEDDELVGVVVEPEGLFKKPVLLPRRFLDRSDDEALHVHLTEDDLRHLQPFSG